MQATDLSKVIGEYLDRLDSVVDGWIDWLQEVEKLTFESSPAAIAEIQSQSPQLMKDLEHIVSQRQAILQQATGLGLRATNLKSLVDITPGNRKTELRRRVNESQVKTSYVRRLHFAIWVTVHQSLQHTNDVIRLITNGKSSPNVYSRKRKTAPASGRLLNTQS